MSEEKSYHDELRAIVLGLIKGLLKGHTQDLTKTTGTLPSTRLPSATGSAKGGVVLSDSDPLDVGTTDPGAASDVSRSDHVHALGSGGALADLSDVALTSPAAADRLRFDGSVWRNSALIWTPVTDGDDALIFAGGELIYVEAAI